MTYFWRRHKLMSPSFTLKSVKRPQNHPLQHRNTASSAEVILLAFSTKTPVMTLSTQNSANAMYTSGNGGLRCEVQGLQDWHVVPPVSLRVPDMFLVCLPSNFGHQMFPAIPCGQETQNSSASIQLTLFNFRATSPQSTPPDLNLYKGSLETFLPGSHTTIPSHAQ